MSAAPSQPQGQGLSRRRFSLMLSASVVCTLTFLCTYTVFVTALELPDDGVTLGSWSDETSRYFGSISNFASTASSTETLPSPPLRVLALTDWQSERRTEFLSSWPNRTSLTLWANRDLATSFVSRTRAAALVYKSVWTTDSVPQRQRPQGNFRGGTTTPFVVSAIGADLLGRGDAEALLQVSDGSLYVVNHSSMLTWTASNVFQPISILPLDNTVATLKLPTAPSVAVVQDFYPTTNDTTSEAAQVGIAFVNTNDQLVLLSRTASTAWPPQYTPHILADMQSAQTGRAVLPLSIVAADVNEDCAAELLYAVRDTRQNVYEVYLFNTAAFADATVSNATLLLQLSESGGERYGDTFTLADMNGDGLPELIVPVQLSNRSGSCATADTADAAETCTAYHGLRIFYPTRATGVSSSPRCRSAASSSEHHLSYSVTNSALFVLASTWCGVDGWGTGESTAAAQQKQPLPLYMPSFPSAPLVLRVGDYNRDRLVDVVVPSSYGPLLLTSRAVSGARPLVCTPLDSTTGKAAVQKAVNQQTSATTTATALDAYRTATPFFATLGLLGRLEVVLTHHRILSATTTNLGRVVQVYQNSEVPSRSYFLSATALTMKSYGAGCIGATHHMTWQDIHMRSHWATVTQQGQTVSHALLPPHVLVGLDETFSYVHEYTVALRVAEDGAAVVQSKEWPSYLVPNSQVFAEVFPVHKPSKWNLQLYLPTSTYRKLLVVSLVIALVVIGLPVIWLRCGEMRQDYNEWRMP